MTLKLYSAPTTNGFKIVSFLELLKVEYDLQIVDLAKGETQEEWFLKLNPLGQIPVLVDGDKVIYESGAILLYLADIYDTKNLYSFSRDDSLYWEQVEWLFVQTAGLGQANGSLKYSLVRNNLESAEFFKQRVFKFYKSLDEKIGSGYIVGDKLSVIDVAFFGLIKNRENVGITNEEAETYPNLIKWFEKLDTIAELQFDVAKNK